MGFKCWSASGSMSFKCGSGSGKIMSIRVRYTALPCSAVRYLWRIDQPDKLDRARASPGWHWSLPPNSCRSHSRAAASRPSLHAARPRTLRWTDSRCRAEDVRSLVPHRPPWCQPAGGASCCRRSPCGGSPAAPYSAWSPALPAQRGISRRSSLSCRGGSDDFKVYILRKFN